MIQEIGVFLVIVFSFAQAVEMDISKTEHEVVSDPRVFFANITSGRSTRVSVQWVT